MPRCIVHADLDAFYAAVEQRDNSKLRGRPVIVGGSAEHRGVVATASYEARRFGVHSAMAMSRALRLCPGAVRVPARFGVYAEVSRVVLETYRRRTSLVEPLALDEAYLDLSDRAPPAEEWRGLGRAIKDEVRRAVGLAVSVGLGTSKSVAKIASDLEKPDGLVVVPPGEERDFLAPLPVSRLWGVGPRGEDRLAKLGVRTIGDLAGVDVRLLANIFGRWGTLLSELANGIDERPVEPSRAIKSIARETTFPEDIAAGPRLDAALEPLAAGVAERLRRRGLRGRTVTLKLRLSDFTTLTRQRTLTYPIDDAVGILDAARDLLRREIQPGQRLRLLGISVSGFDAPKQMPLPLFTAGDEPPDGL
jgi:DNA polymerase-4